MIFDGGKQRSRYCADYFFSVTLIGGVVFLIFAVSALFISDPDETLPIRVE